MQRPKRKAVHENLTNQAQWLYDTKEFPAIPVTSVMTRYLAALMFGKPLLLFSLILAAAGLAASQTEKPAALPTPDSAVVKISTALIQLDVSVTDKRGRVITDLKPEEIEIYENGR